MVKLEDLYSIGENFKKGAFLTTKSEDKTNTMAINWGTIGSMWCGKDYMTVMVRKNRYTQEIIKNAKDFTISIPENKLEEEIQICGTRSGRNLDKSEIVDFTKGRKSVSPIVKDCKYYIECEIIYKHEIDIEEFPDDIIEEVYDEREPHILYYGRIIDYYKM